MPKKKCRCFHRSKQHAAQSKCRLSQSIQYAQSRFANRLRLMRVCIELRIHPLSCSTRQPRAHLDPPFHPNVVLFWRKTSIHDPSELHTPANRRGGQLTAPAALCIPGRSVSIAPHHPPNLHLSIFVCIPWHRVVGL